MSPMFTRIVMVVVATTTVAAADPVPALVPPALAAPPPKLPAPRSLREHAERVATDMIAGGPTNRDPNLLSLPWQVGRWSVDGRANKLDAASGAATLVGGVTLDAGGSPLAAFALFAAAATFDAAAADAEAMSAPRAPKKKRIKHTLR